MRFLIDKEKLVLHKSNKISFPVLCGALVRGLKPETIMRLVRYGAPTEPIVEICSDYIKNNSNAENLMPFNQLDALGVTSYLMKQNPNKAEYKTRQWARMCECIKTGPTFFAKEKESGGKSVKSAQPKSWTPPTL